MNEIKTNQRLLGVLPHDDVLSQCIHCGMCLAVCPTYELTKFERSSPRGRIKLIKAVARGEMAISDSFAEEMNFCLDCQACETACPAGVKYGSMVEAARVEVDNSGYGSFAARFIKKIALKYVLASNAALKFFARLLFIYQNWGLQKIVHSLHLLKVFSPKLEEIDKLAPRVSKTFSDDLFEVITKPEGEVKYKTAFLTGCLMNVMFAEINKDTVDVLKVCGCEVFAPKDQVCCGSLHAHNGDFDTAKKLARKNLDAFDNYKFDFVISNSAGCGAFMKEYQHVLKDDQKYSVRAKIFSAKVKDITEFVTENKILLPFTEFIDHITYHDACHLVHTQKISNQPREIIDKIPGITFTQLEESTWCCGSAGIYNIIHYNESMIFLERKMKHIKNTGARMVVTGNPGCLQQIKYGAERFGMNIEVLHPVTLFKRALNFKAEE
jgi:glycolate oxidase iron-sulfur subunit